MSLHDKILTTIDLSVGYRSNNDGSVLLSGLDLFLKRGELVGLIGENGSGKSTLLRSLAGLQTLLNGEVLINNQNINDLANKVRATKISFVSTELQAVNNISVFDIIALGRFPYTDWFGNLKSNDKEAVISALKRVGLEKIKSKTFSELSDGQKQRVMIARALSQDTDIIVLDEPTAFLDMPNKYEVINLLQEIAHTEDKAIIFSVHDINIALRTSDVIWLIKNGKINSGSPEDLILNGSMEKIFENRNLKFNKETGEINNLKKSTKEICLRGEGIELSWTKKALERLNYKVECNNSIKLFVEVTKENEVAFWNVLENEVLLSRCNSIYELTLYLRNL